MTIDKAIEILQRLLGTSSRQKSSDSWDALKLGVEALKRIRHDRLVINAKHILLLPGETEK